MGCFGHRQGASVWPTCGPAASSKPALITPILGSKLLHKKHPERHHTAARTGAPAFELASLLPAHSMSVSEAGQLPLSLDLRYRRRT